MTPRQAAVASLIGLAALVTAGAASSGFGPAPEAVLARGYSEAFADADRSWSSVPSNIWLSSLGGGGAARSGLTPGDTITIAGKDGRPERLEVTELEVLDGTNLGVPGVRFQLVTGRTSAGGGVVRFIFAAQEPLPAPTATQSGRTL